LSKAIFVTGTDTGVGKTVIAAGLAACLKERGRNVAVMKPVETGCRRERGRLIPQDALLLREAAGCEDDITRIVPYVFAAPLAPALAAEKEGRRISVARIKGAFQALSLGHDLVIVEGAGGLLVPITPRYFYADLAAELALPILLVASAHLGTINHSLLSLYYAERRRIAVIGVAMNHSSPERGVPESTNAAALKRWAGVPFLGEFPFLPRVNLDTILEAVRKRLDMKRNLYMIDN
jgi:dethiobiotin synthetase